MLKVEQLPISNGCGNVIEISWSRLLRTLMSLGRSSRIVWV
jgi:hypothetical protein